MECCWQRSHISQNLCNKRKCTVSSKRKWQIGRNENHEQSVTSSRALCKASKHFCCPWHTMAAILSRMVTPLLCKTLSTVLGGSGKFCMWFSMALKVNRHTYIEQMLCAVSQEMQIITQYLRMPEKPCQIWPHWGDTVIWWCSSILNSDRLICTIRGTQSLERDDRG